MAYKRQISYIDWLEYGHKRGNAGFIKWEKYDECHILSVFINGITDVKEKEAKVCLEDGKNLGKLTIRNGRASATYLITADDSYWRENYRSIHVLLDAGTELVAEFAPIKQTEEKMTEKEPENEQEKSAWDVLGKREELFYPFGDQTGCYRFYKKDMNLLGEEYKKLQQNQFLLHGYYNYKHMIIYKKADKENEYWLGVPGIYHKREVIAAKMFGFEQFEGIKKEYQVGDMGYYLITVK